MQLKDLKSKVDKLKTSYYENNHGITNPNIELLLDYIAELEERLLIYCKENLIAIKNGEIT